MDQMVLLSSSILVKPALSRHEFLAILKNRLFLLIGKESEYDLCSTFDFGSPNEMRALINPSSKYEMFRSKPIVS